MRIRSSTLYIAFVAVTLACSSDRMTGPPTASAPQAAVSMATASHFTCALTVQGQAYCWGLNSSGQLGNGSTQLATAPVAVSGSARYTAIAATDLTVCALSGGGAVWCWGHVPGQEAAASPSPIEQPAAQNPLQSIVVGSDFACGLDASGSAYCWGVNHRGQLGTGDTTARSAPTAVVGNIKFVALSAGFWHTCGLTSAGTTYCWGDNTFGEGGAGPATALETAPTAVTTPETFSSIDAGAVLTCGVAPSGHAYCWGANSTAQLGDGTTLSRSTPTLVAGNIAFATIRAARNNQLDGHTCGIARSGTVYCWGYNNHNQTGAAADSTCNAGGTLGLAPCNLVPAAVSGLAGVLAIDAGLEHSCAISGAGALQCWGIDVDGELGDGATSDRMAPAPVSGSLVFPSR